MQRLKMLFRPHLVVHVVLTGQVLACAAQPRPVYPNTEVDADAEWLDGDRDQPATVAQQRPTASEDVAEPAPDNGEGVVRGASGATKARIDGTGHRYDGSGRLAGRMDDGGHLYDAGGRSAGRVDDEGTVFGADGAVDGRITEGGAVFGGTGGQIGRVGSDGTVFDGTGAAVGKIDSSCTGDCRTQAIHSCFFD